MAGPIVKLFIFKEDGNVKLYTNCLLLASLLLCRYWVNSDTKPKEDSFNMWNMWNIVDSWSKPSFNQAFESPDHCRPTRLSVDSQQWSLFQLAEYTLLRFFSIKEFFRLDFSSYAHMVYFRRSLFLYVETVQSSPVGAPLPTGLANAVKRSSDLLTFVKVFPLSRQNYHLCLLTGGFAHWRGGIFGNLDGARWDLGCSLVDRCSFSLLCSSALRGHLPFPYDFSTTVLF